ncbi:MAG: hypothetical protein IJ600_04385 [Lachnospiraceae bacterium]|nr:hypothetical protein [Lachnospiraceae bacterium]
MDQMGNGTNQGGYNRFMGADSNYVQSFQAGTPGEGSQGMPPKRSRTGSVIALSVLGVALVGAIVLLIVFREVVANSWARMTKSPEDYLRYVVEKNLDSDTYFKEYEEGYKMLAGAEGIKLNGEVRLELSRDVIEKIEDAYTDMQNSYGYYDEYYDYMYEEMNRNNYDYLDYDAWAEQYAPGGEENTEPAIRLDSLSDIALIYEMESGEDALRAMQALQLSDKEYLLTMNEIYDMDKSVLYLQMPELNEDYAGLQMDKILDEDEVEQLNDILGNFGNPASQMIEPKTLRRIYERYLDVLLSHISDVEEEKNTLEAMNKRQNCYVLSFVMDEEMIKDTLIELAETMAEDSDLEGVICSYIEKNMPDEDADAVWAEAVDALEAWAEETENEDLGLASDIAVSIYVSSKGKIQGLRIGNDEAELFYGYVIEKAALYLECYAENDGDELFALTGKGSRGAKGASLDCTLSVDDGDVEIDFALSELTKNGGVFTMDLDQFLDIAEEQGADQEVVDDLSAMVKHGTLRLESHHENKKTEASAAIMDGNDKIAGIRWKAELSEAGGIEIPSGKETEKISDEYDMIDYLQDCDLDLFVDKLAELGLPAEKEEELREEIEWMLEDY